MWYLGQWKQREWRLPRTGTEREGGASRILVQQMNTSLGKGNDFFLGVRKRLQLLAINVR